MKDAMYFCDGTPIGPGGSWIGHVLPGAVLVFWSLHWLQGSMRKYFRCQRAGVPYKSQAYYSWPGLPEFPIEAVVILTMSMLGAFLEMNYHGDGFQALMCPKGSVREGHMNGDHMNNWQHATMYMGFGLTGLVSVVGWWAQLPIGTEKAFLCLAFVDQGLLMGLHLKDEPLDRFLHQALAGAVALTVIAVALEALYPRSYMASCGRVIGGVLQGVILIATAHIMFEPHPAWDVSNGDFAPFQYSKVLLTQIMSSMLAIYVALHVGVQVAEQVKGKVKTADSAHYAHTATIEI